MPRYAVLRCGFAIVLFITLGAAGGAQSNAPRALGTATMTPAEFQGTGMAKLSASELQALNRWLMTYAAAWMGTGAQVAQEACQRKAEAALATAVRPPFAATLKDRGVPATMTLPSGATVIAALTPAGQASAEREAHAAAIATQETAANQRLLAEHGQYCALVALDPDEVQALLSTPQAQGPR